MVHKPGSTYHIYVQTYPVASSKGWSIKCLCLPGSDMTIYNSRMKGLQSGCKVGSNWGILPYNHPAPPEHENSETLKRNTQRQWSIWHTTVSLIITHCDEITDEMFLTALRTQEVGCPKDMYVQKMTNLKIILKILAEITPIPLKCHIFHLPGKCAPETFQSSRMTQVH